MDSIISVQDIRTSLGEITSRAEAGETFVVVRNSKPAFRIVPVSPEPGREPEMVRESRAEYSLNASTQANDDVTLTDIQNAFAESGAGGRITSEDVAQAISEVRAEKRKRNHLEQTRL
jgi:prevent-host-death family protein